MHSFFLLTLKDSFTAMPEIDSCPEFMLACRHPDLEQRRGEGRGGKQGEGEVRSGGRRREKAD